MPYFVKQVNPETQAEEFIEVPDDKLEINPELIEKAVYNHPKYREVVDESIGRKAKIKELRQQLDGLVGEPDPSPKKPATSEPADGQKIVTPQPLDEDALYSKFTARLAADQLAAQQAEAAKANALREVAKKYSLGESVLPILQNATDPEATAKLLEKSAYRFDDQVGGEPAKPDTEALQSRILKNLGLDGDN